MRSTINSRKETNSTKRRDLVGAVTLSKSQTVVSEHEEHARVVPKLFHVFAAVWIIAMLVMGNVWPDRYYQMMQEDRVVEWGTVGLFLAAGLMGLRQAIPNRRLFDVLVALFCLFVAGEEFSWGQRLLGFYPPEYFLANNYQQEVNLHNLPQEFIKPKWILMTALAGYGVLLPLVGRERWSQRLMAFVGASAPSAYLVPWFVAAIVILLWYPLTLTGEWVEFFAGSLFLISMRPAPKILWIALLLAVVFGFVMTQLAGALERGRDAARLPCAKAEAESMLGDIISGQAAGDRLWRRSSVHKRIWTTFNDGYLKREHLRKFDGASCSGSAARNIGVRNEYGIDPWGSPYWLYVSRISDEERLVVIYSFGPNRRRDSKDDAVSKSGAGDDVAASSILRKRTVE